MQRIRVVYSPNIDQFSTPMPITSSYQELLLWKSPNEKIVAIFDLRGQRGYMDITSVKEYNWYLDKIRHDGRTPEKFFWLVDTKQLEMKRS